MQTIHAFCTRLLHQFPFEADVAARFEVLEERTRSELIDRLRMGVLLEAAAKPDSDLGRALATAITVAADQTFAEAIDEAIAKHDELEAWIAHAGGVAAAIAELSRALGVRPDETTDAIAEEFFSASLIAPSEYPAVIAALEQGLKGDKEHAARFDSLRLLDGVERVRAYQSIFCTAELEPRKNIISKGIRDRNPSLFQRLLAEQERVCGLIARRRAVETRERTAALVTIAHDVIARYRAEKNRRGLLDYDDLIEKALHLLSEEQSAWVHYKLDLGIDHVLIDEAQDTSEPQWDIVKALTAEFFAGRGARDVNRSIFAVGDEKQSIFSFQGAEPKQFETSKRHFAAAFKNAEMSFEEVRFQYSFRSAPTVLDAVDTVFKRPEAHAGLTEVPGATVHEAVRANAPGTVESVADDRAGREARHRRLGRTVRRNAGDESAHQACAADRKEHRAVDRPCCGGRRRCASYRSGGRDSGSGAPAWRAVRGGHQRVEEGQHSGRGRRPADAHRAYRRDGFDRARRCVAAAGRRSRAWLRAEEPAVRDHRGAAVRACLRAQGNTARGAA